MMRKLKKYTPTKFKAENSIYDKDAADYAVMFIESLCHTKGTWAGKPFELIDWQEQIIRDVFGILKPNGYRQFNTAYVEIAKNKERAGLLPPWHSFFVAVMVRNGQKSMDVRQIVNRQQSSLTWQQTWCGCVRPLISA